MTRLARSGAVALCVAAAPLVQAAQAPTSLAGVVVSADPQPQPIRRAIVMLTGPELESNLSVVSDDQGRFTFLNLRPGRYVVTASKAAYLTTALGATAPGRPGIPVAIGAGQQVTDVRLSLIRGAVLTGVIRDAAGVPAANASVAILPVAGVNGSRLDGPTPEPILTDDQGTFRAYGLAPGDYLVAASLQRPGREAMVRLAAPTIDAMLRSLQQRGGGLGARSTPPIDVPHPVTYAPVFYPGTPVASEATALRVAAGEVREGIDFTVDLVPTATVEGRVVMSDGSDPPAVQLSLTAVGPVLPFSFMPFVSSGSARQDADGSFAYPNVTPGRYVLFARESPGRNATSNRPGALWAMAALDVAGADLGGVTLTLRPTLRFAGRVAFEGSALPPPKNLSTIRVGLVRIEGALAEGAASGAPAPGLPVPNFATVAADGTFVADGVLPGLYIVSALSPDLAGWQLRSAVVAGRDILDVPLDIGSADVDVSGAVLTFSDRQSQLSGVLQDTSGQPAPGHTVIVFPADRTLWHAARRLQAAQPASDGYFSFGGLPAGHYRLAAVNEMPTADWRRASFLEQAVAASIAVTIAEGATVSQDVSLR